MLQRMISGIPLYWALEPECEILGESTVGGGSLALGAESIQEKQQDP